MHNEHGEHNLSAHVLVVKTGSWLCAIPLREVRETMRRLPIRSIEGALPFVRGLAQVRGALLPVIDVRALLGEPQEHSRTCAPFFVTVQFGEQCAVIEADSIIGAQYIHLEQLEALPSLLSETIGIFVEKLGSLDKKHLAFCSAVKLLSALSLERPEDAV